MWGFVDIIFWRGVWDGINEIFGITYQISLVTLIGGTFILICLKSLKSATAAPVGVVMEDKSNLCNAISYFQTKVCSNHLSENNHGPAYYEKFFVLCSGCIRIFNPWVPSIVF